MTTFLADLQFAIRTLRRAPSFTFAAVVALGLGTGSAAGVFSLLRAVVLRPLPYAQPEQLVMLWDVNAAKNILTAGRAEHAQPRSGVRVGARKPRNRVGRKANRQATAAQATAQTEPELAGIPRL